MLVRELNINEFRGIKSCLNPIELSNFTVLVGRNNSGKSTILEALSMLPSPYLKNYFTNQNRVMAIIDLHRSKKKAYKSLLYLYAGHSSITYKIRRKAFEVKILPDIFHLLINGKKVTDEITLSNFFEVSPISLPASVLFVPNQTDILKKLEQKMEILKDSIMKEGIHVSVANKLNQCVDDKYSDIAFLEPISIRKIIGENFIYLELGDLGAGAEKAIKLMSLIEVLNPKLLLIDDFGAGYHPTLIGIVLEWLKDKPYQTVISTHSIDVLSSLLNADIDDISVLQLYKSNEDVLNYQTLTLDELETLFNANIDPRLLVDKLGL